jgi:hypothetical protein
LINAGEILIANAQDHILFSQVGTEDLLTAIDQMIPGIDQVGRQCDPVFGNICFDGRGLWVQGTELLGSADDDIQTAGERRGVCFEAGDVHCGSTYGAWLEWL